MVATWLFLVKKSLPIMSSFIKGKSPTTADTVISSSPIWETRKTMSAGIRKKSKPSFFILNRPYICKICQKTYYRRYLMKKHHDKKHPDVEFSERSVGSSKLSEKEDTFTSQRDWIDELLVDHGTPTSLREDISPS